MILEKYPVFELLTNILQQGNFLKNLKQAQIYFHSFAAWEGQTRRHR